MTIAVLVIVVACGLNLRGKTALGLTLRLAVPLIASLALHLVRFAHLADIDAAKCVSDVLYDYFGPIGIYQICSMIVSEWRKDHD